MSQAKIPHKNTMTVQDLLELIEGVNRDLTEMQNIENESARSLMIRQLEFLKKDFTNQLFKLLERYQLPVKVKLAA
jgi:hypothetical protein